MSAFRQIADLLHRKSKSPLIAGKRTSSRQDRVGNFLKPVGTGVPLEKLERVTEITEFTKRQSLAANNAGSGPGI